MEMMQKGLSGFRRFLDVMETVPEIQDNTDAVELTNVKAMSAMKTFLFIIATMRQKCFPMYPLTFRPVNRSCAGWPVRWWKDNHLLTASPFYDVTSGKITVDGHDVRSLTLKSLRSQIGVVQQDVYLFSGSIRENIAYGKPDASEEEIIAAAKQVTSMIFIMELPEQYDTFVGERGARLSWWTEAADFHSTGILKESADPDP